MRYLLVFIFCVLMTYFCQASDLESHKNNYIVYGGPDDNIENEDLKYQISLKKTFFEYLNFGMTQVSWWDIHKKSSPFRETNYTPEGWLEYSWPVHEKIIATLLIGHKHQSNGDSGEKNRSWERRYIQFRYSINGIYFSIENWHSYWLAPENKGINKYYGWGEFKAGINHESGFNFTSTFRRKNNIIELWKSIGDISIYCQRFTGFGEGLVSFNLENTTYRCGIKL